MEYEFRHYQYTDVAGLYTDLSSDRLEEIFTSCSIEEAELIQEILTARENAS